MRNKKSKALLTILGVSCTLLFAMPVHASDETSRYDEEISVQYVSLESVSSSLSISSGKATCKGVVIGASGKTCSVQVTLQKKSGSSWLNVKTWSATGSTACTASGAYAISKGTSYRVKVIGKCGSESDTKYSAVKSY
jgi:hypothetical protein